MRASFLILAILLGTGPAQAEATAALDALLAALARPTPASTAFVERRESALLEAPLLLRGNLRQPDADTLLREVESPYRERSTIRAERVVVEREGSAPRRFALRQAPELGALLDSFRALLGADRALLERHYRVQLAGDIEANWRLQLEPRASRRAQRIAAIELYGEGGELLCLALRQADGGGSRMLLGAAAEGPGAGQPEAGFERHCTLPAE
jgi:hypothetical protein